MERIPRCETCRFYVIRKDEHGQCRYNPPTAVVLPNMVSGEPSTFGIWPPVSAREVGCGKHEPKLRVSA